VTLPSLVSRDSSPAASIHALERAEQHIGLHRVLVQGPAWSLVVPNHPLFWPQALVKVSIGGAFNAAEVFGEILE